MIDMFRKHYKNKVMATGCYKIIKRKYNIINDMTNKSMFSAV
jgi:hypothetical protein